MEPTHHSVPARPCNYLLSKKQHPGEKVVIPSQVPRESLGSGRKYSPGRFHASRLLPVTMRAPDSMALSGQLVGGSVPCLRPTPAVSDGGHQDQSGFSRVPEPIGWMDGWMDGWVDGWRERQIDHRVGAEKEFFSFYPSKFSAGVPVTKQMNKRKTEVY